MDVPLHIRSGSLKKTGSGALFATPRSVSKGYVRDELFEEGLAPSRTRDEAEVRVGDVLVTMRGPTNAAAAITRAYVKPLFATLELAVLRPARELDPTYLAWFINLPENQAVLAGSRTGGAVARLPLPALHALPLRIPSLTVQRQIAALADLAIQEAELMSRIASLRATVLEAKLIGIVHNKAPGDATSCTQ